MSKKSSGNFLVLSLCCISFMTMSSFSIMAPFYPLKAKEVGVDIINIGQVMGSMATISMIVSFLTGKIMHKKGLQNRGKVRVILLAIILNIAQNLGLGYLYYVEEPKAFLAISFTAQIIGGIGAGAISTASMAILSSFKHADRERYIGWIEAMSGLGLLFGPIQGAILYDIGNFSSPFWFQALMLTLTYPLISSSLLSSVQSDTDQFIVHEPVSALKQIPLIELLKIPRLVFGMASQMYLMMTIQYIAPTLAIHLNSFGLSSTAIGLTFGIPAVLYAFTTPFVYKLTQRMEKRGVIVIGLVTISLSMLMVGGSDTVFNFHGDPLYTFLGLCLLGLSAGLVSIPVLPEMLESVETNPDLAEKYDLKGIENLISGLYVFF